MYCFFTWMMNTDAQHFNPDDMTSECQTKVNEHQILSIAQDVLYVMSGHRIKTPKQVGLGMAVRHLTSSKLLITVLNRLGNCVSYEHIETIDTSLAEEIIAKSEEFGNVILSNITSGFFQAVANNDDVNETLDGKKTTHGTMLVLYQPCFFGPLPKRTQSVNDKKKKT